MLAYAPRPERRRLNPPALALIVAAHVAALIAVMSARMEVTRDKGPPTVVKTIPLPPEPKEVPPEPKTTQPPTQVWTAPQPVIQPLPLPTPIVEPLPQPDPGPFIGNAVDPVPTPKPQPIARSGPRFATPEGDIRPPYPESKRALDEEAALRLRLSIDERGRVVGVEPVGKADPTFLAAARRHILRVWRYKPAMDGDRPIASTTVITLKFELD